jgi:hypothetical protein
LTQLLTTAIVINERGTVMKTWKAVLVVAVVTLLGACQGGFTREPAGGGPAGYNVSNP